MSDRTGSETEVRAATSLRSDTQAAIVAAGLRKSYEGGKVEALRGVDLEVAEGEFVAVTGPSGCGKSTLIHLLATLDRPDSGTLRLTGQLVEEIKDINAFRRDQIGLIFQLHNLLPHLSALQNVEVAMLGTHRSRSEQRARALEVLRSVNLDGKEHRKPPQLSGGERQRVAIARALVNDPSIILADEPTGNLDQAAVQRFLELFRRIRRERHATIVMVTHDREVAGAADRIVFLADGRVVDRPEGW